MSEPRGIDKAMVAIMADLGGVEKARVQDFKAFRIDDVLAATHPLFVKHGVAIYPQHHTIEYQEGVSKKGSPFTDARVVMSWKLVAVEDGSHEFMSFAAEGRDYQDKATNKANQQALKYALVHALQIMTGEPDPDEAAPVAAPVQPHWENKAKEHVLALLKQDKDEAALAWPLIMAKAEIPEMIEWTKDTYMKATTVADEMLLPT